jgi:hypothetical protein
MQLSARELGRDLGFQRLEFVRAACGHDDLAAGLGEAPHAALADAGICASDEHCLS